jgi:hypothetical protein
MRNETQIYTVVFHPKEDFLMAIPLIHFQLMIRNRRQFVVM